MIAAVIFSFALVLRVSLASTGDTGTRAAATAAAARRESSKNRRRFIFGMGGSEEAAFHGEGGPLRSLRLAARRLGRNPLASCLGWDDENELREQALFLAGRVAVMVATSSDRRP
jgi:hypothetical protein